MVKAQEGTQGNCFQTLSTWESPPGLKQTRIAMLHSRDDNICKAQKAEFLGNSPADSDENKLEAHYLKNAILRDCLSHLSL